MIEVKALKHANPKDKSVLYYCAPAKIYHVNADAVCKDIAAETTITESDVKAALDALQRQLLRYLLNGDSVHLGDIGTFRIALKSKKVTDYVADVSKLDATAKAAYDKALKSATSKIKSICVRFRPSTAIKDALSIKKGSVSTKLIGA